MEKDTDIFAGKTRLADTHWSRLLGGSDSARWDALVHSYWRPVYRYVRRHWGRDNEDAKDLTQQFFLFLIEDRALDRVRRDQGRLRHYVKACLDHFMQNVRRAQGARKRSPSGSRVSLEEICALPVRLDSVSSFDVEWRRAIVREAVNRIEAEYRSEGKLRHLSVFRKYYLEEAGTYGEIATAMGIEEHRVDHMLRDAKRRLRERVLRQVRDSVGSREEFERELRELF